MIENGYTPAHTHTYPHIHTLKRCEEDCEIFSLSPIICRPMVIDRTSHDILTLSYNAILCMAYCYSKFKFHEKYSSFSSKKNFALKM